MVGALFCCCREDALRLNAMCNFMLHFCNKIIAKRYKTAYCGPDTLIWQYSFRVWWHCMRLTSPVLHIRQNDGIISAMKQKKQDGNSQ